MTTKRSYHVIVGGLGSLGRALQKKLLDKHPHVRVLDLAPSEEAAASRLVHATSVDYVPCSLHQEDRLRDALHDAETVYSLVTPDLMNGTVAQMQQTNVDGIQNLLEACQSVGVPKLVYASSMAVTNQLLAHDEETEETPLPSWDTYQIPYDRTKRKGEELVLNAADNNLQTCALRLGGIIASPPGDVMTRRLPQTPGYVPSVAQTSLTDFVSANDIATAFLLASDHLHVSDGKVNGQPIFVTKPKNNQSAKPHEALELLATELNWRFINLPPSIMTFMGTGYRAWETAKTMVGDHEKPGMPFDLLLQAQYFPLTFDNTRAHSLLGWKPQETWQDAILRLAKEFRDVHPDLFNTKP